MDATVIMRDIAPNSYPHTSFGSFPMITKQNLIKCAVFHIFFNLMNQTRTKTEFIEFGQWLELISICLGNERCIVMSYEKIFSDHSYNLEHPKNNFEYYILIQWPSSTRIDDTGMSSPLPCTEALHQVINRIKDNHTGVGIGCIKVVARFLSQ